MSEKIEKFVPAKEWEELLIRYLIGWFVVFVILATLYLPEKTLIQEASKSFGLGVVALIMALAAIAATQDFSEKILCPMTKFFLWLPLPFIMLFLFNRMAWAWQYLPLE